MVMVVEHPMDDGALTGDGVKVPESQVSVTDSPTVIPVGSGTVTMRPVGSSVGTTVGSLDVMVDTVPAGIAEPAGERTMANTSVFPGSAGSMDISLKLASVGVGRGAISRRMARSS